MGKYFGTDGVRGIANVELTSEMAYKIGAALTYSLRSVYGRRIKIAIGRDTRISGNMLEGALSAGINAAGGDVYLLGVLPTPAVALLTREGQMDAGVVISASHNPFEHNGIKIFSGTGYKLDDDQEAEIESYIDDLPEAALVKGKHLGIVIDNSGEGTARYSEFIRANAPASLEGIKVLIDCANGAASNTAKLIFNALGAECDFIACTPNGVNINESCGSTHMETLSKMVAEGDYALGVAFDGDADRCLMCDENGKLIDGDDILALLAAYMKAHGKLKGGVVATIMSNMGLAAYLKPLSIDVVATKVGDRHVLEEMRASGHNLGGEQSGHVILSDYATTGDGQLTAVMFLAMLKEKGVKASELAGGIFHYPQVTLGLEVPNRFKKEVVNLPAVKQLEQEVLGAMGGEGRINIRPSGTEALIRIMVEGKDHALVAKMATHAEEVVAEAVRELMVESSEF